MGGKLKKNSKKYLMMDQNEGNNTYRLFDPILKKYYIHRDIIIFNEIFRCEKYLNLLIIKQIKQKRNTEIGKDQSILLVMPETQFRCGLYYLSNC